MMSIIGKAKELSEQAEEKIDDLVGDDLVVNAILRAANKQDRVNKLLKEKGSDYHIGGFEVENNIPPKINFIVVGKSE